MYQHTDTAYNQALIELLPRLENLDNLNRRLADIDQRLVIAERVAMFAIAGPDEIGKLNNFNASLRSFGEVTTATADDSIDRARRPFTDNEKSAYFTLALESLAGPRAGYDVAELLEIPRDGATDKLYFGFFHHEASLRAYLLFPDLFERILDECRSSDKPGPDHSMALFTAYCVVSRLVSLHDRHVQRPDGSIDDWRLCR